MLFLACAREKRALRSNNSSNRSYNMNKGAKMKNGVDIGQCDITNLTKLSRKTKTIVELKNLGEKQESHMSLTAKIAVDMNQVNTTRWLTMNQAK